MADPVNLDLICDELGVSREEGLYYLEGFNWDLISAMDACRRKLLPPLKDKFSLEFSVIAKSPDESDSSGSSVVINPQKNEISSESKKELIDSFREVAIAMPLKDVMDFLERFNWDLNLAVNQFMDLTYSTPEVFMNSEYVSGNDDIPRASDQAINEVMMRFSPGESSSHLATNVIDHRDSSLRLLPSESHQIQDYSNRAHIGSSSSSLMKVDVAEMGDEFKEADGEAISEVKILESSCPDQIVEEPQPQFKVDRICNEIGVCREEALFYFEGFNWNSAMAMDASRSKTLPPAKVKSSPGVSVNEKSVAPDWKSPSTPVVINSRRISNERQNQTESLPPQLKEELIDQFCSVALGASRAEAIAYLNRCCWSLQDAIIHFMETSSGTLNSQHMSEYDHSMMGQSSSQSPCSPEGVTSKSLTPQSQLQIQESSSSAQEREKPVLLIGNTLRPIKMNSPRILSQMKRQSRRETPSPQQKEEFIVQFCSVALGASREDAIAYLDRCSWSLDDAILRFMDMRSRTLNLQRMSEYDHSIMGQSSLQSPSSSEDVTSKSLAPQSQLQASGSSSSSLMNIDSTETEKSLKEGGDASATEAITPMTTSQVDRNLKDKAVEEHSGKEAIQPAPNTVILDITFHDGTMVEIPLRLDQTIRDIRNKIEVLRPDDSGDYYFMSITGEDYKDLNTPVRKIIKNSYTLMQIYPQ